MLIAKSSSGGLTFLPILLIVGLLYFLFLRPQQQRQRRAREQVSTMEIGDDVITASGIVGRIVSFDGDRADLEVAPGVILTMLRAALTRKANEPAAPPPARRGGLAGLFSPPPPRGQAQTQARPPEPADEDEDDADYDGDLGEYDEREDDGAGHEHDDEGHDDAEDGRGPDSPRRS